MSPDLIYETASLYAGHNSRAYRGTLQNRLRSSSSMTLDPRESAREVCDGIHYYRICDSSGLVAFLHSLPAWLADHSAVSTPHQDNHDRTDGSFPDQTRRDRFRDGPPAADESRYQYPQDDHLPHRLDSFPPHLRLLNISELATYSERQSLTPCAGHRNDSTVAQALRTRDRTRHRIHKRRRILSGTRSRSLVDRRTKLACRLVL